ncbi:hypothetical protein JCM10212_001996 [Sporobolomyces blumeae]
MRLLHTLLYVALSLQLVLASPPNAADYTPIVVPLAVRSPYLGAYLTGRQDKALTKSDPRFWTGTPLGWKGLIRIDGKTWTWMGNATDYPSAVNSSFVHTTAESTFVLTDDPPTVALTARFVSPITPADIFRQSIPFSYLELSAESLDGRSHDVQVYSEVNGLWLADNESEEIEWESKGERDFRGIRFRLKDQRLFKEEQIKEGWTADRILYGDVWYAAQATNVDTTFSAGYDAQTTRQAFAKQGELPNSSSSTFRQTRHRTVSKRKSTVDDEPVFAFSHDFHSISPKTPLASRSQLLTIGHVRDPVVQYMEAGNKTTPLRPLWRSTFSSTEQLLSFALGDYPNVVQLGREFNDKLYEDARLVDSQEYAHVVSISTRQIFAALEAIWDESEEGGDSKEGLVTYSPVTGKPIPTMVMLKEVSSNGNCGTVDVLAPFLPFMVYASPSLIPLLLEPTIRYAATGLYAPVPPPHDIGDHYPSCIGHNDFLYPGLPIEEAGNVLNMMAVAMRTADTRPYSSLLAPARQWWDEKRGQDQVGWRATVGRGKDHRREGARMAKQQTRVRYELLKKWADYLVEESLYPKDQRSTDDFFGAAPNQTSLVIKGITGIRAMSEIAADLGENADRDRYRQSADRMVGTFLELAVSTNRTHLLSSYGNQTSWLTHYNLFYDKLLNGEDEQQFPETIYEMQDEFYPTVAQPYGPPLDSRFASRAKTDWLMWAAGASSPKSQARRIFVDAVARYFRADKNAVFGDSITPQDGWSVGFLTRPVVGGHFSLLALDVMRDERQRRADVQNEWVSEELFWVAVAVGSILAATIAWRGWARRKRGKMGYMELLTTGRLGRRRFSSRTGEEAIWLAETPETGSVFDLGGEDLDDDDDEPDWAKRRLRRRSSEWSRD